MRRALRIACLFLVLGPPASADEPKEIRVYSPGLTDVATAAAVIRPLLSPEGRLVEDAAQRRLIVNDRPEVHRRVAAALEALRVPARNVRIRVMSSVTRTSRERGVAVSGRGRVGSSGVDVRVRSSRSGSRARTEQELLVLSGSQASIVVAEEVPYLEWFWTWGQPHGLWSGAVAWKEVGARLKVQPFVLDDDTLRVRLTPEFSYLLDRERLVTEVHELATEVVVREGEEINLGGIPMSDREFLERFLFGFDEVGNAVGVEMKLKATIE